MLYILPTIVLQVEAYLYYETINKKYFILLCRLISVYQIKLPQFYNNKQYKLKAFTGLDEISQTVSGCHAC